MSEPTILFQPPNRVGLGHLSRLIAIALAVKRVQPGARTPFVVNGGDHGLLEAYGFPYFCLPDHHTLYRSTAWEQWTQDDRLSIVGDVADAMVERLEPSVIVFDCFPHHAMMAAVLKREIPVVICLRMMRTHMDDVYPAIRRHRSLVREILIPHTEGECNVPDDLRDLTCFTGPITRPAPPDAIARYHTAGKLVAISGGGGGYPGTVAFYNLALEAFARARRTDGSLEGLLVTGPLFQEWWQLRLVEGVRVIPFDPFLSATLRRADLLVCQAGYNTMAEVRELGVPALCVPAVRDSDDQFARAERFACDHVRRYAGDDPDALAQLMLEALSHGTRHETTRPSPDESLGARIAADAVLRAAHAALPVAASPE